jgi:hypothetical protein
VFLFLSLGFYNSWRNLFFNLSFHSNVFYYLSGGCLCLFFYWVRRLWIYLVFLHLVLTVLGNLQVLGACLRVSAWGSGVGLLIRFFFYLRFLYSSMPWLFYNIQFLLLRSFAHQRGRSWPR